jgi:hypothetical protein
MLGVYAADLTLLLVQLPSVGLPVHQRNACKLGVGLALAATSRDEDAVYPGGFGI